MRITVLGTGCVGLVTSVCLANTGIKVYCIDKDINKIDKLKKGISPIYEPGLENLLKKNMRNIIPSTNVERAIKDSDVIIITVGTPCSGNSIDLSYIKQASKEIGAALKQIDRYVVVVVKSTVVPETTLNIVKPIVLKESEKNENDIGFCMNPEFLREGKAVNDFNNPDRIVLGVTSKKDEIIMRDVYAGYANADFLITNPTTAEMIKYTANSFLALTISFSNEIARICEKLLNVDSEEVFKGVILDRRISPILGKKRIFPAISEYLKAGCGFGGSCFPKDVKALASFEKIRNVKGNLLSGLLEINETQVKHIFEFGKKNFRGEPRSIAILGTAFKPDTDDIRESPGLKLAQMGIDEKLKVYVHDYFALEKTKKLFKDKLLYCHEPLETVKKADIVFVATAWNKYLELRDKDFEKNLRPNAILIDCRSLYKNRRRKPWRIRVGVGKYS